MVMFNLKVHSLFKGTCSGPEISHFISALVDPWTVHLIAYGDGKVDH